MLYGRPVDGEAKAILMPDMSELLPRASVSRCFSTSRSRGLASGLLLSVHCSDEAGAASSMPRLDAVDRASVCTRPRSSSILLTAASVMRSPCSCCCSIRSRRCARWLENRTAASTSPAPPRMRMDSLHTRLRLGLHIGFALRLLYEAFVIRRAFDGPEFFEHGANLFVGVGGKFAEDPASVVAGKG